MEIISPQRGLRSGVANKKPFSFSSSDSSVESSRYFIDELMKHRITFVTEKPKIYRTH